MNEMLDAQDGLYDAAFVSAEEFYFAGDSLSDCAAS
jgi:hypothetical protein